MPNEFFAGFYLPQQMGGHQTNLENFVGKGENNPFRAHWFSLRGIPRNLQRNICEMRAEGYEVEI